MLRPLLLLLAVALSAAACASSDGTVAIGDPALATTPPTPTAVPTPTVPPPSDLAMAAIDRADDPAGGFTVEVPDTFTLVDVGGDLGAQADTLAVDDVARDALDELAVLRERDDVALAGFEFDRRGDGIDSLMVVRHRFRDGSSPWDVADEYASQIEGSGGEVTRLDVTEAEAWVEGTRLIAGAEMNQYIRLVFADDVFYEIAMTARSSASLAVAHQTLASFAPV